ncbi:endonuclease/exonuclease/phosphatase family protein [Virgibacillus halophilus]|uniref:Endonuclease/exonuclease/phosphatase family protein n=2 Tax=Tigheibacillus halophilus TaxID=361280 RepID=A0ABU5C969_9BACI|nr:endonuclease/exonuclease/phosphatase family protein [Virgibacillus halophilus]
MMEIMSENTYSILMGDMNAGPEAEELSPLLRWFQDGWDLQGEEPGYTYPSNAPEKRIDYIFASKRMQVNASGLGLSGPSDHVPVTAELTLAPGGHSLSIAGMQMLVDLFAKRGEITDDLSAHQLWLHLSAVQHYKKQSKEDKALKHMRSIQVLLKELRKEQTVSDEAYDVLRGDAVYLMNKWQSGI